MVGGSCALYTRPMTEFDKTASMAPRTITEISKGRHEPDVRLPRRRGKGKPKVDVVTKNVDPRVWAEAKRLARGDCHRIEVVAPDNVIVWNAPR